MSGWSKGTVEEQRAWQEKRSRFIRPIPGLDCQPVDAGGVPAEWIGAQDTDNGALLYLHGGAYVIGSINTCRELAGRLARAAKRRVLAIDYRLAPENPYPAALDDTVAAYHWLLGEGVDPSQIVLAGDSAGGGLALAALLALRDAGQPLPAGAVCLSPWTDLALTGASIETQAQADPILAAHILRRHAQYYAGDRDLTTPLISPLYADLTGLPPLLFQVGTDEILLDDARRCAHKARQAGVEVSLDVYEGMFHVFQMVRFLPETKQSIRRIAEFVLQSRARH
jgi:acetyl esterase/lipase